MDEPQYDLMYCGDHEQEIRDMILADFPDATIQDASDFVRRRFSVKINLPYDDWLLWLMRKGVHEMSFCWNTEKMGNPDYLRPLVQQVVSEQKGIG